MSINEEEPHIDDIDEEWSDADAFTRAFEGSGDDEYDKAKYPADAQRKNKTGAWGTPLPSRSVSNKEQFHLRHRMAAYEITLSPDTIRFYLRYQCRKHLDRSAKVWSNQALCDECKDEFHHYYDRMRVRNLRPHSWWIWAREGDIRDIKSNRPEKPGVKMCKWAGGSCSNEAAKW